MAVASGVGGSLGQAPEVTYGTYVAPTRWLEIASASLKKIKNTKQGGGMAAGRLVDASTRRVVTTLGGGGTIDLEVQNKSMGLLLNWLMGGTPTVAQQGATAAWLQTHTLSDNIGKFGTLQVGLPQLSDGVPKPYSFLGSKVLSAEFSSDIDALLMSKFEIDSRDVTEAQALAAPSYPTNARPFHGVQLAVKVGTFGAEASVTGVTGVSVKIDRKQATGRYYAGAAGLKAEPIMNDKAAITGVIKADYVDKTIWADRFAADTGFSLILEWVGPLIASTFFETFRIKLPACFLDGDTPTLDGEDVVSGSFPFTAQFDLTNAAATIEYMSTDTVI